MISVLFRVCAWLGGGGGGGRKGAEGGSCVLSVEW